jgi:hypothetical protein
VWNAQGQAIQGVYLYKFHSILYLFHASYGIQGFVFNIKNGAFTKINQSLPPFLPYLMALNDSHTDFILGIGDGTQIGKSIYPSQVLSVVREAVLQTRHEDADSMRYKVWEHLGIITTTPVYNVRVRYYLDGSDTAHDVKFGTIEQVNSVPGNFAYATLDLQAGDNIIQLFDTNGKRLRSKTISFEITIGNQIYLIDEVTGSALIDETGDYLISENLDSHGQSFGLQELRLKYREVGPEI